MRRAIPLHIPHCRRQRSKLRAPLAMLMLAGVAGCSDAESPAAPASPTPAAARFAITGLDLVSVSGGNLHTCGLTRRGQAICWGGNLGGQFGDGTNSPGPGPVVAAGGTLFNELDAGSAHTCGITGNRQMLCWGNNIAGQLGDGSFDPSNVPVAVSGGHQFIAVSAGAGFTCGVTKGGEALCWGAGNGGQLGNGVSGPGIFLPTPQLVLGGYQFTAVSAGSQHACAIASGGQALCWGASYLGDGSPFQTSDHPVQVAGSHQFVSITAGAFHTCGVTKGGQALCWGGSNVGQLGHGSSGPGVEALVPTAIASAAQFKSLHASSEHTCGATKDGRTLCWGGNSFGQLGNGTTQHSNVPVEVADPF